MLWIGLALIVFALVMELLFGRATEPWNWANKFGKFLAAIGFFALTGGAILWAWLAAPF